MASLIRFTSRATVLAIGICLAILNMNVVNGSNETSSISNYSMLPVNESSTAPTASSTLPTVDQNANTMPPDNHGCHGSSLSCGQIAGIVIGCILFVLLVVAVILVVFFVILKKKRSSGTEPEENGTARAAPNGNDQSKEKNSKKTDKQTTESETTKASGRPKTAKSSSKDQTANPSQFPEVKSRRSNLPPLVTAQSGEAVRESTDQQDHSSPTKKHRRRRDSEQNTKSEADNSAGPLRGLPPLTSTSLTAGGESPEKHRRKPRERVETNNADDDF